MVDPTPRQRVKRLGWLAFGLIASAYVMAFFQRNAPAAIATELSRDLGLGATELGWLAASYFWIYTVMQIPTGVLADTLGPRRIVVMGCVFAGVGALLFGQADSLHSAIIGRSLVGFGVSFPFIALLKINAAWFEESQFATLNGLTLFIGNLGAAMAATPLAWLVGLMSWRSVFAGLGVVSLLTAAATWLWVRDDPEQAGLPSPRALAGLPEHAPHQGHWLEGLKTVAANPRSWPGLFVNLGVAGSLFSFGGLWAVPFLMGQYGMNTAQASAHVTVLVISAAFGALLCGRWSDHLRRRKPVMLGFGATYVLCWLPWVLGLNLPSLVTLGLFALQGLSGSSFTLSWACGKEVNPPALSGMATSLVNTGCFLGAALLQPAVGWVIDHAGGGFLPGTTSLNAGISLLALGALAGWLSMLTITETRGRNLSLEAH